MIQELQESLKNSLEKSKEEKAESEAEYEKRLVRAGNIIFIFPNMWITLMRSSIKMTILRTQVYDFNVRFFVRFSAMWTASINSKPIFSTGSANHMLTS